MDKNICPECSSKLFMSKWFVDDKRYPIDKHGKVSKKAIKVFREHPYEAECGIICENPECSYTTVGSGRTY